MTMPSSSRRRILCGPGDPSVLYLQKEHVSRNIWAGEKTPAVRCRRYFGAIWEVPIHQRVLQVIDEMGFGAILRCDKPKDIDHYLITALIERWRPETHTFHFPVGEATVTLEDVEVLWGLKVDGDAVTGDISPKDEQYWKENCLNYLGICPSYTEIKDMAWKSTTLSKQLRIELSDEEEDYIYVQRARVYCLLLLGGLMIPNATGNKISFFYLQFLIDPERCAQYSWGGATLAALYHNLCEAACGKRSEVGGALTLLQIWAWERISSIRPTLTSPPDLADYKPLASASFGDLI